MSLWAIIPVKPFNRAKSRLADILSPLQRVELSRTGLRHALEVLAQVSEVERTLVISRDLDALTLAREYRAHTVTESGAPDLNTALQRATDVAQTLGAHATLILPSDLPLLSAAEVRQMIDEPGLEPAVVIVPDRRETGTNALFMRPPGVVEFAFGPHSFQHHLKRARLGGVRVRVCHLAGAALDVDTPQDWELYLSSQAETACVA